VRREIALKVDITSAASSTIVDWTSSKFWELMDKNGCFNLSLGRDRSSDLGRNVTPEGLHTLEGETKSNNETTNLHESGGPVTGHNGTVSFVDCAADVEDKITSKFFIGAIFAVVNVSGSTGIPF
jgi:hypothetical protein